MLTAIELEAIKTTLNRTGFLNRRHAEMLIRDFESRIAPTHEQETVENVIEQPVAAPLQARRTYKKRDKTKEG